MVNTSQKLFKIVIVGIVIAAAIWLWPHGSALPNVSLVKADRHSPTISTTDNFTSGNRADDVMQPTESPLAIVDDENAASAIPPQPALHSDRILLNSAIEKTVTDNTPRTDSLMKVFRVVNDPPGLAATVFGNFKPQSPAVVWLPIAYFKSDMDLLASKGLPETVIPDLLVYYMQDVTTGKITGMMTFSGNGDDSASYKSGAWGYDGFFQTVMAESVQKLIALPEVQGGSYELCYIQYGHVPMPGLAYAIWLRSPTGDDDLIYPLTGNGVREGIRMLFKLEPKLYKAKDFLDQIRSTMSASQG